MKSDLSQNICSRERYTTFHIAGLLKICTLPPCIFLTATKSYSVFQPHYCKKYLNILIASTFKSIDFEPKTLHVVPDSRLIPAISHLLKFCFNPERGKESWEVSTRFLTEPMLLSKKVDSYIYI